MQVIDSLSAPTKDPNWPAKIAIGGVLSALVILFGLGTILTSGYSLRVTRGAAEGMDKLPEWDNWGEILWQGFILFLVAMVAFMIPMGLVAFGFGSMIVGLISAGSHEAASHLVAGAGVGLVAGGIGAILFMIVAFFFPMMSMRVAIHRSFGAAFDFGAVLRDISRIAGEYVVMILVLWLISGAATFALGFLSFIPVLPQLLAAAVGFYMMVVCSHTLGTLYRTRLAQEVTVD